MDDIQGCPAFMLGMMIHFWMHGDSIIKELQQIKKLHRAV